MIPGKMCLLDSSFSALNRKVYYWTGAVIVHQWAVPTILPTSVQRLKLSVARKSGKCGTRSLNVAILNYDPQSHRNWILNEQNILMKQLLVTTSINWRNFTQDTLVAFLQNISGIWMRRVFRWEEVVRRQARNTTTSRTRSSATALAVTI